MDFIDTLLRTCCWSSTHLWLDGMGEPWEYEDRGFHRGESDYFKVDGRALKLALKLGVETLCIATKYAVQRWHEDLEILLADSSDSPGLQQVMTQMHHDVGNKASLEAPR